MTIESRQNHGTRVEVMLPIAKQTGKAALLPCLKNGVACRGRSESVSSSNPFFEQAGMRCDRMLFWRACSERYPVQ